MTQTVQKTNLKTGHIRVNGTDLYYEDTGGEGEPIIFSHALLLDSKLFAPQVEALRHRYRCISYDHRGQGKSAEDKGNAIGIDVLTEDVVALIEKLQLGSVHFCGLSMGGFVGIQFAAKNPELLRSLILIGTSADPENDENMPKYKLLNFLGRWLGPASVARAIAPIIYGETTLNDPARKAEKAALIDHLSRNRRTIWRAVNGVIFRPSLHEHLSKIMAPTLIIVGEEDICQIPLKSERLARAISGAKLERIPLSGHAATVEQPAAVNSHIQKFLESVNRK
jgi:3-oxoadipate enol-lactonase